VGVLFTEISKQFWAYCKKNNPAILENSDLKKSTKKTTGDKTDVATRRGCVLF
jgi:hypothetical protein